jgi:hypothetical protein
MRIKRKKKTEDFVVKEKRKLKDFSGILKLSQIEVFRKSLQSITGKKNVNYLLLAISILIIWFLWEITTIFIPIDLNFFASAKGNSFPMDAQYTADFVQKPRPFSEYEENFRKRNLFTASLVSEEIAALAHIGTREMLQNMSLIGIIATGSGYRAIINDKKEKKSTIYKEGDEIAGFTIETIKSNKVIFRYAEGTFELTRQ